MTASITIGTGITISSGTSLGAAAPLLATYSGLQSISVTPPFGSPNTLTAIYSSGSSVFNVLSFVRGGTTYTAGVHYDSGTINGTTLTLQNIVSSAVAAAIAGAGSIILNG